MILENISMYSAKVIKKAAKVVKEVAKGAKSAYSTAKRVIKQKKEASKVASLHRVMKDDKKAVSNILRNMKKDVSKTKANLLRKAQRYTSRNAFNQLKKDMSALRGGVQKHFTPTTGTRTSLIGKTLDKLKSSSTVLLKKAPKLKPLVKVFKPIGRFVAKYGGRKITGLGIGVSAAFIAEDAAAGNTRKVVMGTASVAAAQVPVYGTAVSLAIDEVSARADLEDRIRKDWKKGKVDVMDVLNHPLINPMGGLASELGHGVADALGIDTTVTVDADKAVAAVVDQVNETTRKVNKAMSSRLVAQMKRKSR